jgi:hypothetical protein
MAKIRKIIFAAAAVTAVAASSAFTAGMTGNGVVLHQTASYGTATVDGAVATNVKYITATLDPTTIGSVEVTFLGDLDGLATGASASTVQYGFAAQWSDGSGVLGVTGTGAAAAYAGVPGSGTTTVTFTAPPGDVTTVDLVTFSVSVTGPPIVL